MPHKHKRKRGIDDDSIFDLPPTARAKSLPTHRSQSSKSNNEKIKRRVKGQKSRPNGSGGGDYSVDDTPRAFKQLMAFQQHKMNSGQLKGDTHASNNSKTMNDKKAQSQGTGSGPSSKSDRKTHRSSSTKIPPSKVSDSAIPAPDPTQPTTKPPKILPGESLRDFSARVDQLLPLSTVPKNSSSNTPSSRALTRDLGLKEHLTRHNKRLQKMIAGWRAEDDQIKQRRLELEEEQEDSEDDDEDGLGREAGRLWRETGVVRGDRKGKKLKMQKKKKKNAEGNGDDDEEEEGGDPFAAFTKRKLEETRQKNLQDVVQAPPSLALGEKRGIGKVKLKDRSSSTIARS